MTLPPKAESIRQLLDLTGVTRLPTYDVPASVTPYAAPHWTIQTETAVPRRQLLHTDHDREVAEVFGLDLDAPDTGLATISPLWTGRDTTGHLIKSMPYTTDQPTDYDRWLIMHALRIPDPWMPVAIQTGHDYEQRFLRLPEAIIETMRRVGDTVRSYQAAKLAHLTYSTWKSYVSRGRAPKPVATTPDGNPVWSRAEVEEWVAARPGRGARTDLR